MIEWLCERTYKASSAEKFTLLDVLWTRLRSSGVLSSLPHYDRFQPQIIDIAARSDSVMSVVTHSHQSFLDILMYQYIGGLQVPLCSFSLHYVECNDWMTK